MPKPLARSRRTATSAPCRSWRRMTEERLSGVLGERPVAAARPAAGLLMPFRSRRMPTWKTANTSPASRTSWSRGTRRLTPHPRSRRPIARAAAARPPTSFRSGSPPPPRRAWWTGSRGRPPVPAKASRGMPGRSPTTSTPRVPRPVLVPRWSVVSRRRVRSPRAARRSTTRSTRRRRASIVPRRATPSRSWPSVASTPAPPPHASSTRSTSPCGSRCPTM